MFWQLDISRDFDSYRQGVRPYLLFFKNGSMKCTNNACVYCSPSYGF